MSQHVGKRKLHMPLSEFAKQDKAIKLYSRLFGEHYWLVPSPEVQSDFDAVVYYVSEVQLLKPLQKDKEFLKQIHLVKKLFNGTIVEVKTKKHKKR